jgi:hypothetical protein
VNLPATVPLRYQRVSDGADPGAKIGEAEVRFLPSGDLFGVGRLDVKKSAMARAVHERMLLPSSNPNALSELSVGFWYETEKTRKDDQGITVIRDAELEEISVVHRGAQHTEVSNVKERKRGGAASDPDSALKDRLLRAQLAALDDGPPEMPEPVSGADLRKHLTAAHGSEPPADSSLNEMRAMHGRRHTGSVDHPHRRMIEDVVAEEAIRAAVPAKSDDEYRDELNRMMAVAIRDEVRRARDDEDEMAWDVTQKTTRGLGGNA